MSSEGEDLHSTGQSDTVEATERVNDMETLAQLDAAETREQAEIAETPMQADDAATLTQVAEAADSELSGEEITENPADEAVITQTEENLTDETVGAQMEKYSSQAEQSFNPIVAADVAAGAGSDMLPSVGGSDGVMVVESQPAIGDTTEPVAGTVDDVSYIGTDIQSAGDVTEDFVQDVADIDNPDPDTGSSVEHVDEAPPEDKSEIDEIDSGDDPSGGSDGDGSDDEGASEDSE